MNLVLLIAAFAVILAGAAVFWLGLRQRNVHQWFWAHVRSWFIPAPRIEGPVDLVFCFVDHFEPLVGKATVEHGARRLENWMREYPRVAADFKDSDGVPPRHSYFFPAEEYQPQYLDRLGEICRNGMGEVEIHLHHDNDTAENFTRSMADFMKTLRERHGMLPDWKGRPAFSFIHGNWALDNSRCDGRWCGLNNEIQLLRDLNCYADFTFPSAPSDTQPSTINSIYYAVDDPQRPKSHDTGVHLTAGGKESGDLLIIQGPLTLNWKRRKFGIWPRVENGDFAATGVAMRERVALWVRQAIHVKGMPSWRVVKIHTHGLNDDIFAFMFGSGAFRELCEVLRDEYNDGRRYRLHYVSARECYNIVKAAQAGRTGNAGAYRDFEIPPPPV